MKFAAQKHTLTGREGASRGKSKKGHLSAITDAGAGLYFFKTDEQVAYLYLDARVAAEMLKKVVLHSVATALASIVFPVPGGPNISTPCHTATSLQNMQSHRTAP